MTIESIPTIELLAEVDRRAQAEEPPAVHFLGVWPGPYMRGHFRVDRHGRDVRGGEAVPGRPAGVYPWNTSCGANLGLAQVEGRLWHWHHPTQALTLLLSWDRSGDKRHGSVATFIIHAHVTASRGLELARSTFPGVFQRIEAHLGRKVELAGEAALADS